MRFRILVVEDHEPFRLLICQELRRRPEFQVIGQAADGLQAVEQAELLQPDLVLMDIGLPKLNGLEAARQIRALAPRAKLVFVSQETSCEIVSETVRFGGQGYVHKVGTKTDLLPALDAVLAGRRFFSSSLDFTDGTDPEARGRHELLFCSDDEILLDALADFMAGALNSGNAAAAWVTDSHREDLLRKLSERGVGVEAAIQQGTCILPDVAGPLDPAGIVQAINALCEAASRHGSPHPRVAVCGERAGRLWVEGKPDLAMQVEQFCSKLARSRNDVDILCPYPLCFGDEDDDNLKGVCAEHTGVNFR